MKWYDEEVAHNLLWMKPGVKFWWRQTAVGPVAVGRILRVNTAQQWVVCKMAEDSDQPPGISLTHTFKLGLHEPQHMSTYPETGNGYGFTSS